MWVIKRIYDNAKTIQWGKDRFGNAFLTPKALVKKKKKKQAKLGFMETKKFSASKGTIHSIEGQLKEWDRISADHVTDNSIRELLKLNTNKKTNKKTINSKSAKEVNKHFSKEYIPKDAQYH